MLIDGIHVPLTVPFARDGVVALNKLESNVRRYSLSPVAGLVAMPPGGEADALSEDEIVSVLQAVGRAAAAEKVLVAGIAKQSVRGALWMAQQAAAAGFDAVLVGAPSEGFSVAETGVYLHAVADEAALPVMLWSDASRPLSMDLIAELARHQNVIGVYDAGLSAARYAEIAKATADVKRDVVVTNVFTPATLRMQAAAREESGLVSASSLGGGTAVIVAPAKAAVKMRSKTVGFQVMAAGTCDGMLSLLEAGVAGAMPQLAACAPQASYEIYAAFKDGDSALSAEKANRVRAADALMQELGVAGMKYGCDVNGYAGGVPRLPRLALTAEQRGQVERVLAESPS